MTLTYERLYAIKRRLAAATPGPWKTAPGVYGSEKHNQVTYTDGHLTHSVALCRSVLQGQSAADADFIAHAPEDLALLLKVIETAIHSRDFALGDHGYLRKRHWSDDI